MISFDSGLVISGTWESLKNYVTTKLLSLQYEEEANIYSLFAKDDDVVYSCYIYRGITPDGIDQTQNDANKLDFESNFKSSANQPIILRNIDGNAIVSDEPRIGVELVAITHNFCDKTTWYTRSVRVTDESLTDDGVGLIWSSLNTYWIDMTHGKIFDEDAICNDVPHGYSVVVTVNGVVKTQRAPFASSGGDYTVNYVTGQITSVSGSWTGMTVLASYSYATNSEWTLVPDPGYRIDIEDAEAQFSKNMIINDSIEFDAWVYNPADLPNKILYTRTTYKTMANYVDEARGCYPVIPSMGGAARGSSSDWYGFPFRYGTIKILKSSQGAEIRVRLQDNLVFGGEHATATFYCTVRVE